MNRIPIIGKVPSVTRADGVDENKHRGEKIARVDAMNKSVQAHLNGIAAWFDDPKITLVVRNASGDFILTNDDCASAVEALHRHEKKAN